MAYNADGVVLAVLSTNEGVSKTTGKPWKSMEMLLQTTDKYPKKLKIKIFGEDKIAAANVAAGSTVSVTFDLDSREWHDPRTGEVKYFMEANAIVVQNSTQMQPMQPVQQPVQQIEPAPQVVSDELPF